MREVSSADREFLLELYAGSRSNELAQVPWSDAQKQQFIASQFEAQDRHYRREFANASFSVILRGEEPIGRIYVAREESEITVIEITLLPDCQKTGIGTRLVEALLEEARASAIPVRLHVELRSPARQWYERLGFVALEEQGMHLWMEWNAQDKS